MDQLWSLSMFACHNLCLKETLNMGIKKKSRFYQVFPRLFGNTNTTNNLGGTIGRKWGTGKSMTSRMARFGRKSKNSEFQYLGYHRGSGIMHWIGDYSFYWSFLMLTIRICWSSELVRPTAVKDSIQETLTWRRPAKRNGGFEGLIARTHAHWYEIHYWTSFPIFMSPRRY